MIYEWKHVVTGEVVETYDPANPPGVDPAWRRVYSFGVGSIQGAGNSKARSSGRFN